MTRCLKQIVFWGVAVISFYGELMAQSNKTPNFIGLNPSITIEPYYNKGEMDLNILPFVYQRGISNRLDFRVTTILNLGIRNGGNKISHYGLESALPIFIKSKEGKKEPSKGLFLAPIISLTRNDIDKHNNMGCWIESGYHILFDNKFALSLGLQVGGTYFVYDVGRKKWGNHFGIKIIFGRWI